MGKYMTDMCWVGEGDEDDGDGGVEEGEGVGNRLEEDTDTGNNAGKDVDADGSDVSIEGSLVCCFFVRECSAPTSIFSCNTIIT